MSAHISQIEGPQFLPIAGLLLRINLNTEFEIMSDEPGEKSTKIEKVEEKATEDVGAAEGGGTDTTKPPVFRGCTLNKKILFPVSMETLSDFLARHMGIKENPPCVLEELTLNGIAKYLASDKVKNVITMAGAGISTSAGIPDFRSPGTGLYDNLAAFDLPSPQAIFEIEFFRANPKPFFVLAKELYPGLFK
ncbi:NAD-dependent protein deacetylase sirtuin-2, partial [Plakobranchus ocellatus]